MLVLLLLGLALGGLMYNLISAQAKHGTATLLPPVVLQTQSRPLTNEVDKVEIDAPIDLYITPAKQASLVIEADSRLLNKIIVDQQGRTLRISTKGLFITMNDALKITLNLPAITELNQRGSGNVVLSGFTAPQMTALLSGSGDTRLQGQFKNLLVKLQGSGNADINSGSSDKAELQCSGSGNAAMLGKAADLTVSLSGSGNVDAQRMIAQNASAGVTGSGNVKLYANQSANLTLSGSGNIDMYGNPARHTIKKTGSGEISWD